MWRSLADVARNFVVGIVLILAVVATGFIVAAVGGAFPVP